MNNIVRTDEKYPVPYRIRIMSGIAVSELLILLLVLFWPAGEQGPRTFQDLQLNENEIYLEETPMTTQATSPPPPPRPQVPEPVPDDVVIQEELPDFEELDISELEGPIVNFGEGRTGNNSEGVASNPDRSPRVVRIVEPTVPEAAKQADVKARVTVNFLVNQEGQVEEASIEEIRLYRAGGDTYELVDRIGYGLTESTINAALRWRFRPAEVDGNPVRAYTRHVFTYGF